MKKVLSVLFVTFLVAGSFSIQSCSKCTNCTYTYEGPNGTTLDYNYPELCGSNSDIDDLKTVCANAAAAYTNGNCTCIDD